MQVFLNEDGSEMELGRGGFGVVLRGTYRMAPVAIKRLKDQSLEQQEIFMREMALLRGCRGSRYIVPFVGASLQPVIPFPSLIPARADQWPSSGGSVSEAAGGFMRKTALLRGWRGSSYKAPFVRASLQFISPEQRLTSAAM